MKTGQPISALCRYLVSLVSLVTPLFLWAGDAGPNRSEISVCRKALHASTIRVHDLDSPEFWIEITEMSNHYRKQVVAGVSFRERKIVNGRILQRTFKWIHIAVNENLNRLTGGLEGPSSTALKSIWREKLEPMSKFSEINHLEFLTAVDIFSILVSDRPEVESELIRRDKNWDPADWKKNIERAQKHKSTFFDRKLENLLALPIVSPLSPRQLIRLYASGIAPLGETINVTAFDGTVSAGYKLPRHDMDHAATSESHWIDLIPDQARRFVDHYFAWADQSENESEQMLKDLWLLEAFHEIQPLPMVKFDANSLRTVLTIYSADHLLDRMVERVNDENDYKGNFKSPPTKAQVEKSFQDVLNFVNPNVN